MTKQPYFALLQHQGRRLASRLRRYYLVLSGLRVKAGGSIGRIQCKWPRNLVLGADCVLEDDISFRIANPFADDNYVELGDRVFVGEGCRFVCMTRIVVGNDTMIAPNTTIVDVGHETHPALPINQQPILAQEIIIGEDVWIGAGAIILKGVTIGRGSVIGAGSLVNKPVPAYQMWAGTPARFIRRRD